jgi:hypothetical protein
LRLTAEELLVEAAELPFGEVAIAVLLPEEVLLLLGLELALLFVVVGGDVAPVAPGEEAALGELVEETGVAVLASGERGTGTGASVSGTDMAHSLSLVRKTKGEQERVLLQTTGYASNLKRRTWTLCGGVCCLVGWLARWGPFSLLCLLGAGNRRSAR